MQVNPVLDRGPMIAVRDPALIYQGGVLRCFHTVAELYTIGPGHFVIGGDAWMDGYHPVPIGLTAEPVFATRVAESTKS